MRLRTRYEARPTFVASEVVVSVVVGRFDPLMARGLGCVLAEDRRLRVLAEGLGDEAVQQAVERLTPAVVILEGTIAGSLLTDLKACENAPAVLVLVPEAPKLYRALLEGTGARCVVSSISAGELIAEVLRAARATRAQRLTRREQDVLDLINARYPYAQIAQKLGISEATVKTHSSRLRRKLGARSRRELTELGASGRRGDETTSP